MTAVEFLNEQQRVGNLRDTREAMKSEDASVSDMLTALSTSENYDKAQCVVHVLNAFNLSKIKLTGTCEWTVDDLRAFSFAVRALGTSWELSVQAQEAIDRPHVAKQASNGRSR